MKKDTLSRVYLLNGIVCDFWHDYKTCRSIENRANKIASEENTSVEKIYYALAGKHIKK